MTPTSPKRTFLFDIGKVLLDFDFESSLRRLFPNGSTDVETRLSEILEPKDSFERGDIPLDDYRDHLLDILGGNVSEAALFEAWRDIFTPNLPMWEIVKELRDSGHRLLLFSNTNAIHCPWILENFSVFDHFEAGTYSFQAGFMKPEPEIYHSAINTHGLGPAETLYIDDLPANIATGRSLGFRSHQYDLSDHSAFDAWLAEELARKA